jgi:hypothetical protein
VNALQIKHLMLALVLALAGLRFFLRYRKLHQAGDTHEISPRILIIIPMLLLVSSAMFIYDRPDHKGLLAIAWVFPFLLSLLATLRLTCRDVITYNVLHKKIGIPSKRRKMLFILIILYVVIYTSIQFIDPALILQFNFLRGYLVAKGIIAGVYVGMSCMYIYRYIRIPKNSSTT